MKIADLDEPTSFLDHVFLGCTQRELQTEWIYCWGIYKDIWFTYFCWSNWKVTRMWKTSRKVGFVVLRHGRTCSKMRWDILLAGKQKSSNEVLLGWSPVQQGRTWISWKISKACSRIVLKCLYLARIGRKNLFMVCRKTCTSCRKMGSSLWQTLSSFDLLYSSHEWSQTILSCGQHGSALSTGFIPRLRLCWRQDSYVSLEAEHLSTFIGCARNKRQYPTVLQNLKSCRWTLDCEWMDHLPSTSGTWWLTCSRTKSNAEWPIRLAPGNWCGTRNYSSNKTKTKTPTERSNRDVDQVSNVDYVP